MNQPAKHSREEEAAAYAFDLMEAAERIAFVKAMKDDPALQSLVEELSETAAAISLTAPATVAPAAVREQLMQKVSRLSQDGARQIPAGTKTVKRAPAWIGWAAALVLLLPSVLAWQTIEGLKKQLAASQAQQDQLYQLADRSRQMNVDAMDQIQKLVARLNESDKTASELQNQLARSAESGSQLKQQLDKAENANKKLEQELAQRARANQELKVELARVTQAHDVAKMQIATLQSTVKEFKQGVAVVVWNSEKQEGILKLEKMPPLDASKDYQLWVVDPTKKAPVNAGVVTIDPQGFAKVAFKPTLDIQQADKFALSVEKKGGVPQNEGPIVLLSP